MYSHFLWVHRSAWNPIGLFRAVCARVRERARNQTISIQRIRKCQTNSNLILLPCECHRINYFRWIPTSSRRPIESEDRIRHSSSHGSTHNTQAITDTIHFRRLVQCSCHRDQCHTVAIGCRFSAIVGPVISSRISILSISFLTQIKNVLSAHLTWQAPPPSMNKLSSQAIRICLRSAETYSAINLLLICCARILKNDLI